MKRLLIIDGNAIVHRAFHALPPLTNSQGEQVNAVYGFFAMLLKVLEDVKPEYLIVCFDRPKPTFRKTLFVGYQAHRPQMAEGLSGQFGILHKALEKSHVAIYELDGYEADDVIGTLAAQATQNQVIDPESSDRRESRIKNQEVIEVKIVTGDRDLLQLVNKHVTILFPILGITKMIEFDEHAVEEKYGITPEQFIDYKALIGDQSDGYPGVSGIGPKTAANLLQKFKTFENMYHNLGDVPPKIAERLAIDAEQAALAKKLATIVLDVPVTLKIEACATNLLEKEGLSEVFEELAFESLKKRLENISIIKIKAKKEKEKLGSQMSLL